MSPAAADAIIVGSGPNGLAAAVTLARAGLSVQVREAAAEAGGGTRSEPLTLPGFVHDVCSAAHPLGAASPIFRALPLEDFGLRWIRSPAALAHPLNDGTAALLWPELERTASGLGMDARNYRSLLGPLVRHWQELLEETLQPLAHLPRHPLLLARFGLRAIAPASALARARFRGEKARALFAGIAAHSSTPLQWPGSAAIGLVLAVAGHAVGWPIAEGGSGAIARALLGYLGTLGGEILTSAPVESLDELPGSRLVILDLTPRQALRVAGHRFPERYRRVLSRFRYGPGVFKMDWALSGPIPWTAADCLKAATVHLGATLSEIVESERAPVTGKTSQRPFVLLTQPSLFDPSRAPPGHHTAWAYCHVPHGSTEDMAARIEEQIERFAPGFRSRVLARHGMGPAELERRNPNLVGGDISGGLASFGQLLCRPAPGPDPYRAPTIGNGAPVFLCSSSTPPGPGAHGMCGYRAARSALRIVGAR